MRFMNDRAQSDQETLRKNFKFFCQHIELISETNIIHKHIETYAV